MNIRIEAKGTSALLMHNPQMVDPEFDVARKLKEYTSKRKKTDDDLAMIAKLEWYGGLYVEQIDGSAVVVLPTSKMLKCIIETAKINKLGKTVTRALSFNAVYVPLIYDGPSDVDKIFANKQFHSRLSVVVSGRRVMRTRPLFFPWALTINGFFVEDAGINFDELERIVEMAGVVTGIGDNRINGYGRFEGKLIDLEPKKGTKNER